MPVDLSASYYDQYQLALRQAQDALASDDVQTAASAYERAALYLEKYSANVAGPKTRLSLQAKALQLRALADKLPEDLARGSVGGKGSREPIASDGADDLQGRIQALISHAPITWDDIAGLESTKREIKTAYALTVARKPTGVQITSPKTLLLYGPPGTGKTLLAAATSNGLEATFFSVKVSDLLSKYFGESSRLVSALYLEARRQSPSVIFLDEFDAVSRMRGADGESGPERRLLSTLLSELDGLDAKGDPSFVLTIAATNRPWDLDSAIRSRFAREVYVPLPDVLARKRMLEIHLRDKGHPLSVSYDDLVSRTAGYSGREISQLCEYMVANMVQRLNPSLDELVDQGKLAVSDYELKVGALNQDDLQEALQAVGRPETGADEIRRYELWLRGNE